MGWRGAQSLGTPATVTGKSVQILPAALEEAELATDWSKSRSVMLQRFSFRYANALIEGLWCASNAAISGSNLRM